MKTITITTPDEDARTLSAEELRDLSWLLGVLDEWLLYAEPSTIRELGQYLQSVGSKTTPPTVQKRVGELHRRIRELRDQ